MLSMLSAEQTKRGGGVVRWWGEVYKSQLRTRIPVVLYRLWSCSNWDVHVMNSPHKGQWRGALMFSVICIWINCWVNNSEAGDLRRHRAHYYVSVMIWCRMCSEESLTITAIRLFVEHWLQRTLQSSASLFIIGVLRSQEATMRNDFLSHDTSKLSLLLVRRSCWKRTVQWLVIWGAMMPLWH